MKDTVLIARSARVAAIPAAKWLAELDAAPDACAERLAFMTPDHHRVRYFVVDEMTAGGGRPLPPDRIAARLELPHETVVRLLDELEKHLFFLVRNEAGEVSWAYPVTSDVTPHRLGFRSGERLYAAWAHDALAAPFVQGRLTGTEVEVEVETVCARTGRSIRLLVDSEVRTTVLSGPAEPLLFEPSVDWSRFTKANIVDDFWRNCQFFWSEDDARDFRQAHPHPDGVFLTLDQAAIEVRVSQAALFAFDE